jgi:Arc/MetJ-type ribon-helix-helix transcriptional regulator
MSGPERPPLKKTVGFDHAMIEAIEKWRARQEPMPNTSEAIRQLVEMGLASAPAAARRGKEMNETAAEASELAGEMIDWLRDKSAPAEEQAQRKRRLINGPPEFREMRNDLPKPKG